MHDDWLNEAPPWQAFPDLRPEDLAARQGAQEAWLDTVWRPFWLSLTEEDRQRYHRHWQTSAAWRRAMADLEPAESADELAAEARESAEYLRRRREALQQNRPLGPLNRLWANLTRRGNR